jgi:hypothetical protein
MSDKERILKLGEELARMKLGEDLARVKSDPRGPWGLKAQKQKLKQHLMSFVRVFGYDELRDVVASIDPDFTHEGRRGHR